MVQQPPSYAAVGEVDLSMSVRLEGDAWPPFALDGAYGVPWQRSGPPDDDHL